MAPARRSTDNQVVGDLSRSSLELDSRTTTSNSPLNDVLSALKLDRRDTEPQSISPLAAYDLGTSTSPLLKRAATNTINGYVPGSGSKPASAYAGPGFLALFALLGTAMVCASIWFFFWAKHGGFHFQENDWDDYKTTVLRRKGPDGKTLSNATKSTRLGGGSVVHGQDYMRAKSEARTVVGKDEKGRKGILAKRGWGKTHSVFTGDDYQTESFGTETVSDMTEVREIRTQAKYTDEESGHSKRYRDRDMHHYKREKVARVGGINRVADGSHFDYSGASNTDRSDTYTDISAEPLVTPKKNKPTTTRDHIRTAHENAERNAKIEAAKMERRWKREAEEAAAALAQENAAPTPPRHAAKPAAGPSHQKQRSGSRSASPKKRDVSYDTGSEVLSTAYTGSSRQASYYDAYRPQAEAPRGGRQSPQKKRPGQGGYRRGADSDLE